MRFRPCIDIHNGKIKQIVGGSLSDRDDFAVENFVTDRDGSYYAGLYRDRGLYGGHIILLNPRTSPWYVEDVRQAGLALAAWPGAFMVGGGITAENAQYFLHRGASHVIVTSYVFSGGQIHWDNLKKINAAVGRDRLVLDLSCRKKEDGYYIVTDRWQKFTKVRLTPDLLDRLASCCDEYLVHAVDAEGKCSGIEEPLADLLGSWGKLPVTYAGGVGSMEDLKALKKAGRGRLDVTIGSALDLFGGSMDFEEVLDFVACHSL